MTEEEIKKAIADAVAEARKEDQKVIDGLKKTNVDLKAEKSAKDEEARKLAEDKAKLENDSEALEKAISERVKAEYEPFKSEAEKYKGIAEANLIDAGLSSAAAKANIDPALQPALIAYLKSKGTSITDAGEAQISGKPLGDFVAEFAASDEGAHYKIGRTMSGGNNRGNQSTEAASNLTKENYDFGKALELAQTDPAAAAAWAETAGDETFAAN